MKIVSKLKSFASNSVNKVKDKFKSIATQKEKAGAYDRVSAIVKDFGKSTASTAPTRKTDKPKSKRK